MTQFTKALRTEVEVVEKFVLHRLINISNDPILELDHLNLMIMKITSILAFKPSIKVSYFVSFV